MCGLYSLTTTHEAVRQFFPEDWEWSESADLYVPSAKVGPSAKKPGSPSNHRLVVLQRDGAVRFGTMRWRFDTGWKPQINATIEKLFTSSMFKNSALHRRCLVIVDGFYEPKGPKGGKRDQYSFRFDDGRPFALGAIWKRRNTEDDDFYGFAIVTTNPGAPVAGIHPRSPVILDSPAERDTWLEGDQTDVELFEQAIDRPDLVSQRVENLY